MTLNRKIDQAVDIIVKAVMAHAHPVAYSSFGKDSMVLLSLIQTCGYKFPVIFHREAFCPIKYRFANKIIEEYGYSVYDYPPLICSVIKNGTYIEIINWHTIGNKFLYMPTGIDRNDKGPLLCGFKDILCKPKADYAYPWDVAFVGQKSSDVDPILGPMTLEYDIKTNPASADFAYPLRHFTDADIWTYTERFNLPVHDARYDRANGYREFEDRTCNPDYFPICMNCLDRDGPKSVWCNRLGMETNNISGEVPYSEPATTKDGPPKMKRG
jgi:hypothetical protein